MKSTALIFASLALVAAACSGGAGATQAPSQAPAPTANPTAMPSAAGSEVTVSVAQSSLGAYLVGPNGHALYVLTTDSANTSTCSGGCAQAWPPLTAASGQTAAAGAGVTGTAGTFARADGSMQVSVGGSPLYYYAQDTAAGQTNGQGVGGVWFLAAPDGSAVGGSATSASPPASSAATAYTITLVQSSAGAHLAGEDGKALYVLTNDSTNTSTCVDQCATNWPPFLLEDGETAVAGDGVTGAIATLSRPDGTTQVSVGGMPVYYFAADTSSTDIKGQGINGVWFLAGPDGTPLTGAASGSTPSPAGYQKSFKPY